MVQLSAVEGSRSVCYLAIRAVMIVDRAALSTLRALHEKGKSGYGSISPSRGRANKERIRHVSAETPGKVGGAAVRTASPKTSARPCA